MSRVGPVLLLLAAGCHADPVGGSPPASVTAPLPSQPSATVVGVGGCAGRGCHGALEGDKPSQTAARQWLTWDKHGRAFDVLFGERSVEIVARLGDGWRCPPAEPRCLACHVTPALADKPSPLHADGVGCEACHTTPGRSTGDWLIPHQTHADTGAALRPLHTASDRAAACVGCHVGEAGREVTHDLLAAGHPRLNFDLLTFLELMPPHWDTSRDTEPKPLAWQAGQLAAVTASLTLAADRAAGSGPWPELADRNCFACHHGLTDPGAAKPAWTSPLVSAPLAEVLRWGDAERAALATADRATAAGAWRGLCAKLKPVPLTADRLAEAATAGGARDWDGAAQAYYALRAAGRSGGRLADVLRLPLGANSPTQYDPAAVRKLMADVGGLPSPKR